MRLIKMLGLAAIAALAAMAFLGAGTASADVLCLKAHEDPCAKANIWEGNIKGLTVDLETLKPSVATLLAGSFEVKCHSEVLASNLKDLGDHNGLLALILSLTFTSCSGSCTGVEGGKAVNTPYHALASALNNHLVVTKHTEGGGLPSATLVGCTIFKVKCAYTAEAESLLSVHLDELTANKVQLLRTGGSGLCPAEGFWDATYLVEEDPEGGEGPLPPLYLAALRGN